MINKDWGDFETNIQNILQNAVDSGEFRQLGQSFTTMVNKTIAQYQSTMPKRAEIYRAAREKKEIQIPDVYGDISGVRTGSVLKIVFGSICAGLTSMSALGLLIARMFLGFGSMSPVFFLFLLALISAWAIYSGIKGVGRTGRFRKYLKFLGAKTYSSIKDLSRAVGKPASQVKDDIKYMIDKGWFLEGHMDDEEVYLITTDETYQQYRSTQKQSEELKKQADMVKKSKNSLSPEVREVLRKGNAYVEQIHRCNDHIPGVEISAKISRMEQIVAHIFQRVQEHPENVDDLKRMMSYYLPTTVKLLEAYEELDHQPIQGENILRSKKEIEDTLDTLNVAFEKLLDSIFQDTAWDVSSDISVLNTVLAQEGLTQSDFSL